MKKWRKRQDNWLEQQHIGYASEDYLKYVLEQAEILLIERLESGRRITKKALTILSIAVSLISGLFVYLLGDQGSRHLHLISAAWLSCICCLIAIYYTIRALRGYYTKLSGATPKALLDSELLTYGISDRELFIRRLDDLQQSLSANESLNRRRNVYVEVAMYSLVLIPFTLPIFYCLDLVLSAIF